MLLLLHAYALWLLLLHVLLWLLLLLLLHALAAAVKTTSSAGTDMAVVLTDVSAATDVCTAAFEFRLW
jgi:hypothetical protein